MADIQLLLEAEKRGILPADKVALLTEARNRGLIKDTSSAPAPTKLSAEDTPGVGETLLIGAGRTFDRIGKGMKQVYYGATGNEKAQAELKTQAEEDDKAYRPLQDARPIATGIGEALPSMAIPIGGAATAGGTALKLLASGAAPELLKYGSAEERLKDAATSGAASVVGGQLIPKAAGLAYQGVKNTVRGLAGEVTPEAIALYRKAQAAGVPVNAAQLGDSRFLKTLASTLEQLPFTGAAKEHANQAKAFTRAVSKTFGDDTDSITQEVYKANRERLGKTFEDLSMRNTLNVDDKLMARLDSVLDEARQFGSDDTVKAVNNVIDRLLKQANASADMTGGKAGAKTVIEVPGAAYQSLDSAISKASKAGDEKSTYLKAAQAAIRDAMDNSISGADKEAWDTARAQYRNLKAVRNAVATDGATGRINPTQLMTALNTTEAGREAMAKGTRGDIGDLARIGKQFVRDAIPNSGTVQRGISMGLLGGGGIAFGVDPMTMATLIGGAATTGRGLTKAMNNPKNIEKMTQPMVSLSDLKNIPPAMLTQLLGSGAGVSTADAINRR